MFNDLPIVLNEIALQDRSVFLKQRPNISCLRVLIEISDKQLKRLSSRHFYNLALARNHHTGFFLSYRATQLTPDTEATNSEIYFVRTNRRTLW
jgi:hypothetical protein